MGVELAAVEGMLDEIYESLPSGRDQNGYTLGRIGTLNVVVAVMPAIGNNRAASVAMQLLNDFRSIRFGLLVGTGGGVPGKEEDDIRLGDIVVSKPTTTFGGVVQYDIGKVTVGGILQRTGTLKPPSTVLMATVQRLQTQHFYSGSQIPRHLTAMLKKYPNMRKKQYVYQGEKYDQLFEATYAHNNGTACQNCDQTKVVQRPSRYDTDPEIHYGTIGSSNAVIKDGAMREHLRKDLGVLCLEMEAAGLMDEFPCLVIRGICDYADSHKNKRWQPYAAATAAAYMKELLDIIPAPEIAKASKAAEALQKTTIFSVPFPRDKPFVVRKPIFSQIGTGFHDGRSAASVLQDQGKYEAAEEMNRRAMAGCEKVLGVDHPDTLTSVSDLASVLQDQGKFEAAEEMNRRALIGREKMLGVDRPNTLTSVRDLVSVLQDQGKYEAAEEMGRRAVAAHEKVLGVDHRLTLISVSGLASVLQDRGKYEAAEEMNRRALIGREKVLGVDHPDTLTSVGNLALVLQDQGKYEAAEEMNRRALAGYEKVLGFVHPPTPASVGNLASVLRDQGKYKAVEEMIRWALAGSRNNLAGVLKDQSKYGEAELLYRQTLQEREDVLGKRHPDTLTSRNNLAGVLKDQRKYVEAELLYRQTLQEREDVLGQKHPDTLMSRNNLAGVLRAQSRHGESELLYRQTLQEREEVLGKKHPDTLTSLNNLRWVLQDQLKYNAVEELYGQALKEREESPVGDAVDDSVESAQQYHSKGNLFPMEIERDKRLLEHWNLNVLPNLSKILGSNRIPHQAVTLVRQGQTKSDTIPIIKVQSSIRRTKEEQLRIGRLISQLFPKDMRGQVYVQFKEVRFERSVRQTYNHDYGSNGFNCDDDGLPLHCRGICESESQCNARDYNARNRSWALKPPIGSSIGVELDGVARAGTLGAYILLDGKPYALTAHHICADAEENLTDPKAGIEEDAVQITSPSLLEEQELKKEIDWLNERLKPRWPCQNRVRDLDSLNSRENIRSEICRADVLFGTSKFSSGYRNKPSSSQARNADGSPVDSDNNYEMDWAILKIDERRFGENSISRSIIDGSSLSHRIHHSVAEKERPQRCSHIRELMPNSEVYCVGRTSGYQRGVIGANRTWYATGGPREPKEGKDCQDGLNGMETLKTSEESEDDGDPFRDELGYGDSDADGKPILLADFEDDESEDDKDQAEAKILGEISTLQQDKNVRFSYEWIMLPSPDTPVNQWKYGGAGLPGNSGAGVMNISNELVGLLWGRIFDDGDTYTLLTPMMEIIDDLRERHGVKHIDLCPPKHQLHGPQIENDINSHTQAQRGRTSKEVRTIDGYRVSPIQRAMTPKRSRGVHFRVRGREC
jgi:nucleoside phosphorylase